ncbi:MAG: substrate-binding domain-containing protein [Eubacterium sp.]|nr:substrate-binding domain-containing protein [Eubacterium sp.]
MMAGFKGNPFSIQREEVFKKILADNNIPFDDSMISYGEFWADPTREATKEILKRDVIPDAIICANDIMAINVSAVLQDNGYRVPEDVMVSGFDGFEEVFYVSPKIATSSCDTTLLAEESH